MSRARSTARRAGLVAVVLLGLAGLAWLVFGPDRATPTPRELAPTTGSAGLVGTEKEPVAKAEPEVPAVDGCGTKALRAAPESFYAALRKYLDLDDDKSAGRKNQSLARHRRQSCLDRRQDLRHVVRGHDQRW